MADLGELIGSLMAGIIRARRMADEQTAVLAEYYRTNPLLESLSVPRIRIPELTLDVPFIIEGHVEGEDGEMENPLKIAQALDLHLKLTLEKHNITINPAFHKAFVREVRAQLEQAKRSGEPVLREAIVRSVQEAFADTLQKTRITLTPAEKEKVAKALRDKVSTVGINNPPVGSRIVANIRTEDVKERASSTNVARLKITLKEEGLEWAVQASDAGGVTRTLQPE